jgi:hypothetical protein
VLIVMLLAGRLVGRAFADDLLTHKVPPQDRSSRRQVGSVSMIDRPSCSHSGPTPGCCGTRLATFMAHSGQAESKAGIFTVSRMLTMLTPDLGQGVSVKFLKLTEVYIPNWRLGLCEHCPE